MVHFVEHVIHDRPFLKSWALCLVLLSLLSHPPVHSESLWLHIEESYQEWVLKVKRALGFSPVQTVAAPVPSKVPVARPRTHSAKTATDRIYLQSMPARQNYRFRFSGLVTNAGRPISDARVLVQIECDGLPQVMEVVTRKDGYYSADMPVSAPGYSRVDWMLKIQSPNQVEFEKSGRRIVSRESSEIQIVEPVEFLIASLR